MSCYLISTCMFGLCFVYESVSTSGCMCKCLMSVLTQLLVRTDSQAVKILVAAVDALVTLFLILSVIFFAVTASIYLAVQVRK